MFCNAQTGMRVLQRCNERHRLFRVPNHQTSLLIDDFVADPRPPCHVAVVSLLRTQNLLKLSYRGAHPKTVLAFEMLYRFPMGPDVPLNSGIAQSL
jgi:hypothetical protein